MRDWWIKDRKEWFKQMARRKSKEQKKEAEHCVATKNATIPRFQEEILKEDGRVDTWLTNLAVFESMNFDIPDEKKPNRMEKNMKHK